MQTFSRALSLVLVLVLAPVASLSAQEAAGAEPTLAEQEFAAGEAAFEAEQYVEALRHFRAALEAAPHDAVRFNIAACLERLSRVADARAEYAVLAASAELSDEDRAFAAENAERLRPRVALVHLGGEAGATPEIDGRQACALPCDVELDPGEHRLALVVGDRAARETIVVGPGEERSLALELDDAPLVPGEAPRSHGPGWLLGVGTGLAVLGVAAMIGTGVRALDLHGPTNGVCATQAICDEGNLMVTLFNVSLGVSIVGVAMIVTDLVLAATGNGTEVASADDPVIRF